MYHIQPVSTDFAEAIQQKIDLKTKPQGSLGILEKMALQIGSIQHTLQPKLSSPTMLVFAGDNGIVDAGVSPFPKEVTHQMVLNFLHGGAAINVFCNQHNIDLKVVDAGVDYEFEGVDGIVHAKMGYGTRNFLEEPAMSVELCRETLNRGFELVEEISPPDCNVMAFGEMGIGNTSSAAALMSSFCDLPVENCVGRGTGLDDNGLKKKIETLTMAVSRYPKSSDPIKILSRFAGFEIVMMTGAMLKAASLMRVILVDGFIATTAVLAAIRICPLVREYCIFTHVSNEQGHRLLLDSLKATPLLDIGMRLGEGSGAAVAYPVVKSAVHFLNEMASFESAGVSNKE